MCVGARSFFEYNDIPIYKYIGCQRNARHFRKKKPLDETFDLSKFAFIPSFTYNIILITWYFVRIRRVTYLCTNGAFASTPSSFRVGYIQMQWKNDGWVHTYICVCVCMCGRLCIYVYLSIVYTQRKKKENVSQVFFVQLHVCVHEEIRWGVGGTKLDQWRNDNHAYYKWFIGDRRIYIISIEPHWARMRFRSRLSSNRLQRTTRLYLRTLQYRTKMRGEVRQFQNVDEKYILGYCLKT